MIAFAMFAAAAATVSLTIPRPPELDIERLLDACGAHEIPSIYQGDE